MHSAHCKNPAAGNLCCILMIAWSVYFSVFQMRRQIFHLNYLIMGCFATKRIRKGFRKDVPNIRYYPYRIPKQLIILCMVEMCLHFLLEQHLLSVTCWIQPWSALKLFWVSRWVPRQPDCYFTCIFSLILWIMSLSWLVFTEHTKIMSTKYFIYAQFIFAIFFHETRSRFWRWCCESFCYMKSPVIKENI